MSNKLSHRFRNSKYYIKLHLIYEKANFMLKVIRIGYGWSKDIGVYRDDFSQDNIPLLFPPDWEEKILNSEV